MTTKSKYRELLISLYKKTINRKLDWVVENQQTTPMLAIAQRKIVLHETSNENGEPLEVLTIENDANNIIETFNDEVFSRNEIPDILGFDNFYIFMKEIREMAYKQAIGADDAIDEIILKLGENE